MEGSGPAAVDLAAAWARRPRLVYGRFASPISWECCDTSANVSIGTGWQGRSELARTAHPDFWGVEICLIAHRGLTSLAVQLRCVSRVFRDTNIQYTFRLGTFRTLSGYFLTYFFLPLREWRAQINLT
jgi:hypothetical protein